MDQRIEIRPDMHPGTKIALAAVQRELDEMAAANEAVADGLQMRSARAGSRSMVYSIRLDRGEVETLEQRAAAYGLRPTVLARNLIRMGLAPRGTADEADAIDRLASALDDLRGLLAY